VQNSSSALSRVSYGFHHCVGGHLPLAILNFFSSEARVDDLQKANNCQANSSHRLERGESRLKVRKGRIWDHYCAVCVSLIIQRDIADLQTLQLQFPIISNADQPQTTAD
jgi:hypothetical protein